MNTIFISYRRSDSLEFCRRMAAELEAYFGMNTVFLDQTAAQPGADWPQRIHDTLNAVEVALVVIGPQWLQARDETNGRRRIDVKDDWVRKEIITALYRKEMGERLMIIPVLVGSTSMPEAEDLGEEISKLCDYQAVKLPDTGSHHDFDILKDQLIRYRFQPRALPPANTPRLGRLPRQLDEQDEAEFEAEFRKWEWEIVDTPEPDAPGGFRRELHRVYEFPTFDLAFQFMNEVAKRGIQPHNHHPRWQNAHNRVEVWLTTFNIGYKPSNRDVRLARVFEEVWREYKPNRA